jgi:uncharacterized protein YndB with AHSA1/START domain
MIDENGDVVHEVRFAHPVERVWNAITDRDALAQWLMGNDFEARVGHRFEFDRGGEQSPIDAEVLQLDPLRRIQWRWTIDGAPTTVTIVLRADGDCTVLDLRHTDLPPDPRRRFDGGWVEKFEALTRVLKGADG